MNRETKKNAGWPKKVPQQILQNDNSEISISKEQRKLILFRELLINPKYNKDTSLSCVFFWEQHEVPKLKKKQNFKF